MGKPKYKYEEHKCKLCGKRVSDRAGLVQHMLVHSSEKPFSCEQCAHTCKSRKYLNAHIKKVHKKATGNACKFCGKKFHYKSLLQKHIYTHTNERPYKCEVCNKGFNSTYTLSTHRHIHSGAKPFKCEFCSYACRDSSTLRKHQERHLGVTRLYQCTACDKSYKTKRVLKVHVGQTHMHQDMKTMPCPDCGKMFATAKNLSNHIRVFHERLYECKCDICGMRLSNKYNMRAHLNRHMDFRPFKCTFEGCDKKFKDKTTLKKHAIIHYPDRHFACRVCDRRFTRMQRFKAHELQHRAKVRCVVCDYCGKSFYNKNYVRSHIARAHVRPQRYQCDVCGLLTHNKPSIVMHLKYGHAADEDRQCKICKKTYKKHVYLKLHYWNTHCIKYKMNRQPLTRRKKRYNCATEESEDMKGLQLLHDIKVEPVSDTEDARGSEHPCEGPDTARGVRRPSKGDMNKNLADFFIEHVIVPSTSDRDFPLRDTGIDVDVKTHKEAERAKMEMLNQWRRRRETRTRDRVKRGYGGSFENTDASVKNEEVEITLNDTTENEEPMVKDEMQNNKKNLINDTDINKEIANCNEKHNTEKETIRDNDNNYAPPVIDRKIRDNFEGINIEPTPLEFIKSNKSIIKETTANDDNANKVLTNIVNDNLNDHTKRANEKSKNNRLSENNNISNIDSRERDVGTEDDLYKDITKDKDCGSNMKHKAISDFDKYVRVIKTQTVNGIIDKNKRKISDEINETNKEKLIEDEILNNKKSELNQRNIKLAIDNNGFKKRRCVRNLKRKTYNESESDNDYENSNQNRIAKRSINQASDNSDSREKELINVEDMELLKPTNTLRSKAKKTGDHNSGDDEHDDDYKPDDEETDEGGENDKDEDEDDNEKTNVYKTTRRRARNVRKKDKTNGNDTNEDARPDEERNDEPNTSNGFKINIHQCYVCFKMYETKEKLLDHCKEHFDVCNAKMLKKCPLCEYVTMLDLRRHIRAVHKINVNILYGTLKDRKNNNNKSRFYFNVEDDKIKEIEVIPSIKNLNRQAYLAIDRKRRENNDKCLKKTKLVKKDGEWIVERIDINAKDYVLPEKVDKEILNKDGDYAVKMQKLSKIAKINGQKMLFPCDKCAKICQTLSALKLHTRIHDPNKKPFKKKVWKHKLSESDLQKLNITPKSVNDNRYAKPKPITNKHKCDPKLKDFYTNNIKGGDIEFWQFLKIFNKMTRENVNDFSDLEKRTEFGNHFHHPKNLENENLETDIVSKKIGNSKFKFKENKKRVVNKFRFKRTILISRKEYINRKAIRDAMRERILKTNA